MISLKKYLDEAQTGPSRHSSPDTTALFPVTIAAYRSALEEMGSCSLDACPAIGEGLKQNLSRLGAHLSLDLSHELVEATGNSVKEHLQDWGRRAARHFQQQTGEVKEILIVMARTAESVGERDQRCAKQISEVTARLRRIANLEDLTLIRASIERSAAELKTSIDKMAAEGKAAIEQLRVEVSSYQTKLEEAENIATRDSLTGLRSRLWVESQIERMILLGLPFCVAILDMDDFKQVNDHHGHLAGDELLKQFAIELKSACRSSDIIGRWGGDEFIILLDCALAEASAQTDRLRDWVCGDYTIQGPCGPEKLRVDASIGLAEHIPNETLKALLARADGQMYERKAASRAHGSRQ